MLSSISSAAAACGEKFPEPDFSLAFLPLSPMKCAFAPQEGAGTASCSVSDSGCAPSAGAAAVAAMAAESGSAPVGAADGGEEEAEGVTCTLDGECTADWGDGEEEVRRKP